MIKRRALRCEAAGLAAQMLIVYRAIDQHGNIKTEDPDAAGDLPDLPLGMNPWVAGF